MIKEIKLKIINFKATLPKDFVKMISVTTIPKNKITKSISGTLDNYVVNGYRKVQVFDTFMYIPAENEMQYRANSNYFSNRAFCIRENYILFIGTYRNFILFRLIQKLIEYISPEKVILKYISNTKTL